MLNMEPWTVAKKSFKLVWRCHLLLSGLLAKGHLPRMSRQLSVADRVDNEIIPGAVHRSPGVCLMPEETPGKPQLGDRLMKRLFASNEVPFLHMRSVVLTARQEGRRKERRKGWGGFVFHRAVISLLKCNTC